MKTKFNLLLFFCVIFLLQSCRLLQSHRQSEQNSSITKIPVDVTSDAELKLSDFFENFRMIRLEADIAIGSINRIRYENNHIYVLDERRNTIFIFSDSGKLLSYIRKAGRMVRVGNCGPDGCELEERYRESNVFWDFVVNNDTIIVLDWGGRRLLKYNHSGEFLSEHRLRYHVRAISPTINQYNFLFAGNEITTNFHRLHRVRNGNQPGTPCLPIDERKAEYLHIRWDRGHHFFLHQNAVYFSEAFNDTIYKSVNGEKMKPAFVVDYKGKNVPESFFDQNFANVMEFLQEFHKIDSYAHSVYSFVMSDRFLMFVSFFQRNRKLTLFDQKGKISQTFSTVKDDVFFNGLVTSIADFAYYADNRYIFLPLDDRFVEWRDRYHVSEQFRAIIDEAERNDNPLLLIFSLKN